LTIRKLREKIKVMEEILHSYLPIIDEKERP
jgi:hypothetical protein